MPRLNLLQSLRQSIPFLARDKGGLPRGEMLALRPVRAAGIVWEMKPPDADSPGAMLTVPRRAEGTGWFLSRILPGEASKKIELDEINAQLWVRCDGQHSVDQLIKFTCDTYKMNRRQGEVGVVTAMRMFAQRGLVGLPKHHLPNNLPNNLLKTSDKTAGKGTPHVHRSDRPRAQSKGRKRRY